MLGIVLEFLALVAIPLCSIPFHISRNYNEGWNAYFAQAAISGGVLYPSVDSMMINNYPPLSFYIIGAVGKLVGDNIVAGRMIAFLALMVIARNVFEFSRWLGADRMLAGLSMGVFLLGIYTLMPQYIALNDPGFLAHAFVTSAGLVFLRARESRLWQGMFFSALLMLMGGLIKHNTISLPLAFCAYTAFNDRRRLGVFLITSMVIGMIAGVVAYSIWGMAMLDGVLFHARQKSIQRSMSMLFYDLPFLLLYIAMTIIAWLLRKDRQKFSFVLWYLVWSMFNAFWMFSGVGVNQNVMCDTIISLSLGTTIFIVAINDVANRFSTIHGKIKVFAVILVSVPWMATSLLIYLNNPYITTLAQILDAPKWERLSETLARSKGPVACETLAICYWAHKPMEIDFFNYGQKLVTGSVYVNAPTGFLAKISKKTYTYVVIERIPLDNSRLPRFLMEDLFRNYEPPKSSQLITRNELFLIPRS